MRVCVCEGVFLCVYAYVRASAFAFVCLSVCVSVSVCVFVRVPALQPRGSWPGPAATAAPPLRWSEAGPAPTQTQHWET